MPLICPRCAVLAHARDRPGTAFALYCRRCLVRLQPIASTPVSAPEPAVRYGGYTFGPRSEDGHAA